MRLPRRARGDEEAEGPDAGDKRQDVAHGFEVGDLACEAELLEVREGLAEAEEGVVGEDPVVVEEEVADGAVLGLDRGEEVAGDGFAFGFGAGTGRACGAVGGGGGAARGGGRGRGGWCLGGAGGVGGGRSADEVDALEAMELGEHGDLLWFGGVDAEALEVLGDGLPCGFQTPGFVQEDGQGIG